MPARASCQQFSDGRPTPQHDTRCDTAGTSRDGFLGVWFSGPASRTRLMGLQSTRASSHHPHAADLAHNLRQTSPQQLQRPLRSEHGLTRPSTLPRHLMPIVKRVKLLRSPIMNSSLLPRCTRSPLTGLSAQKVLVRAQKIVAAFERSASSLCVPGLRHNKNAILGNALCYTGIFGKLLISTQGEVGSGDCRSVGAGSAGCWCLS